MLVGDLARRLHLQAAGIVAVTVVELLPPLLAAELDLLGVDHDHVVAVVDVRRPGRLVLARKRTRNREPRASRDAGRPHRRYTNDAPSLQFSAGRCAQPTYPTGKPVRPSSGLPGPGPAARRGVVAVGVPHPGEIEPLRRGRSSPRCRALGRRQHRRQSPPGSAPPDAALRQRAHDRADHVAEETVGAISIRTSVARAAPSRDGDPCGPSRRGSIRPVGRQRAERAKVVLADEAAAAARIAPRSSGRAMCQA